MKFSEKLKKTEYAAHTSLIGLFQEDGVICNPFLKEYKEDITAIGGSGDRKIFKRFNDTIIEYHKLLEVLTGERRANIYEEIPVIDFLHKENTGFNNKYLRDANGRIIPSSIQPIDSKLGKSSLDLILEEDPYTINRALIGEEMAEHFYNTTSVMGSIPDIQTSPYKVENLSKLYKGVYGESFTSNGIIYQNLRKPTLLVFKADGIALDENLIRNLRQKTDSDLIESSMLELQNGTSSLMISLDYSNTPDVKESTDPKAPSKEQILKNHPIKTISTSYLGAYPLMENSYIRKMVKNSKGNDEIINYKFLEVLDKSNTNNKNFPLKINLEKNDIYIIIPKTAESPVQNTILLFKYVDVDKVGSDSGEPLLYESKYKLFVGSLTSYSLPDYLTNTRGLYTVNPDDDFPEFLFNIDKNLDSTGEILSIIRSYIKISYEHFTYASGLLNGLFSVPKTIGPSIDGHRNIQTWEFIDDFANVNTHGNVITPGTKYFPGHLLNRGYFLESPLKLTYHDYHKVTKTYVRNSSDGSYSAINGPSGDYIEIKPGYYKYVGNTTYERITHGDNDLHLYEFKPTTHIESGKTYYKVFANEDTGQPIMGKASLLLDLVTGSFKGLGIFERYVENVDIWRRNCSNYNNFITSVIVRTDYSRESVNSRIALDMGLDLTNCFEDKDKDSKVKQLKSNMCLPNKFKNQKININGKTSSNEEPIGVAGIKDYINNLMYTNYPSHPNRIENGVFYLSLNDPGLCCDITRTKPKPEAISKKGGLCGDINGDYTISTYSNLESDFSKSFAIKLKFSYYKTGKLSCVIGIPDYSNFRNENFSSDSDFKLLDPLKVVCPKAYENIINEKAKGWYNKTTLFGDLQSSQWPYVTKGVSAEGDAGLAIVANPRYSSTHDHNAKLNILISPENPDIFPENMFLFSKDNLGLEKGKLVSFSNIAAGKILIFKVDQAYAFEPTNVTKIKIYDPVEGNEYEIERFYDIISYSIHETSSTEDITDKLSTFVDINPVGNPLYESYKTYYLNTNDGFEAGEAGDVDSWGNIIGFETWTTGHVNSRRLEGSTKIYYELDGEPEEKDYGDGKKHTVYHVKKMKTVTWEYCTSEITGAVDNLSALCFKDCYIYILKPLDVSLEGSEFYTQFDSSEKKDTYDFSNSNINIFPVSYPSDSYFAINVEKNPKNGGRFIYRLKENNIYKDFKNYLQGSQIIPSLPRWSPENPEEVLNNTLNPINISLIGKLYKEEFPKLNKMISNTLFSKVLGDWQISDGFTENGINNPLTMRYIPDLINGLEALPNIIDNAKDLNFKIVKTQYNKNGAVSVSAPLEEKDLRGLKNRLEDISSGGDIVSGITKMAVKLNNISENAMPQNPSSLQDAVRQMFTGGVQSADKKCTTITPKTVSYEYTTNRRDSLSDIKNTLEEIFNFNNNSLDVIKSKCGTLDSYFSREGSALIRLGEKYTRSSDPLTIVRLKEDLKNLLFKKITTADKSYKKCLYDSLVSRNNETKKVMANLEETYKKDIEDLTNILKEDRKARIIAFRSLLIDDTNFEKNIDKILENPLYIDDKNNIDEKHIQDDYSGSLHSLYLLDPPAENIFPYNKPPYQPVDSEGNPLNNKIVTNKAEEGYKVPVVYCNIEKESAAGENISYEITNESNINNTAEQLASVYLSNRPPKEYKDTDEDTDEAYKAAIEKWKSEKKSLVYNFKIDSLNVNKSNIIYARNELKQKLGSYAQLSYGRFVEELYLINPGYIQDSSNWSKSEDNPDGKDIISDLERRTKYDLTNNLLKKIEEENLKTIRAKKLEILKKFQIWCQNNPNITKEIVIDEFLKRKPKSKDGSPLIIIDLPESLDYQNESTYEDFPTFKPLEPHLIKSYIDSHLKTNVEGAEPTGDTSKIRKETLQVNFEFAYPSYGNDINANTIEDLPKLDKIESESDYLLKIHIPEFNIITPDIQEETLRGLADFIITSLEGTNPKGSNSKENKYVEYTYKDKKLMGRPNSLYYKRYQILNNRMNKLRGPLGKASILLYGRKESKKINDTPSTKDIYSDLFKVVPIEKVNRLDYLGKESQVEFAYEKVPEGKYYYREELDALKSVIGDKCLLTCTKCLVKNTCPYYNEDGILKTSLTPAGVIDFWFKDNELDLLWYEEKEDKKLSNKDIKKANELKSTLKTANLEYMTAANKWEESKKEYENIKDAYEKATGIDKDNLEILLQKKKETLEADSKNKKEKKDTLDQSTLNYNKEIINQTKVISNSSPDIRQVLKDEDGALYYGDKIPQSEFKKVHNVYADIAKKQNDESVSWDLYNINPLDDYVDETTGKTILGMRTKLKKANIDYNENDDNLGRLIGARYGTVEKNSLQALLKDDNNIELPKYKYLYDAVYLLDDYSEFKYAKSNKKYEVSLDKPISSEIVKHYRGFTYIKIPYVLKALDEANEKDKVYFVSDDTITMDGKFIDPVVYLGTVGSVKKLCEFDVGETENLPSSIYEAKSGLYSYHPWDIAQWCVNYIKGSLEQTPLNNGVSSGNKNNLTDMNKNRDQFWMPYIEKLEEVEDVTKPGNKVIKWVQKPGRPRSKSKSFEPLTETGTIDAAKIVSGKPYTANYFNFIRRMSIRIWDNNKNEWLIPWVDESILKDSLGNSFSESNKNSDFFRNHLEAMKEYKRRILPNMRTNPRLVIVSANL